jgi:hypothetical protein
VDHNIGLGWGLCNIPLLRDVVKKARQSMKKLCMVVRQLPMEDICIRIRQFQLGVDTSPWMIFMLELDNSQCMDVVH